MGTTLEKPTLANLNEYPIADAYPIAKLAIEEMAAEYMPLAVEQDGTGLKEVHDARIKVKNTRVAVEKTRKELKADALAYGRKVDGAAKELFSMLEPIEEHLTKEEKTYEEEQARIKREAEEARQQALKVKVDELAKYGYVTTTYEVDAMTDAVYAATLEEAKQAHAEKLQREADEKAEQERLEVERKAREEAEREKQAAEQERLRAEQSAFERVRLRVSKLADFGVHVGTEAVDDMNDETFDMYLAKAEREFKAKKEAEAEEAARQEAEARKLREEREALEREKQRILEEKAEAERKAELERREKEAAERAAQAERERIEAEQAAAKAKAEAEEDERKRKELLRPDCEKLESFAASIEAMELPTLSKGMEPISISAHEIVLSCANGIRELAAGLLENQQHREAS